jgi:hypothetical protein
VRQFKFRFLRLMVILIVMIGAIGTSGEIGRAASDNPLTCWLAYSFETRACGVPQSCEARDIACRMANQPINDCLDQAASNLFDCFGAGGHHPPLEP